MIFQWFIYSISSHPVALVSCICCAFLCWIASNLTLCLRQFMYPVCIMSGQTLCPVFRWSGFIGRLHLQSESWLRCQSSLKYGDRWDDSLVTNSYCTQYKKKYTSGWSKFCQFKGWRQDVFSSVFLMTFGSLLHGCPYEVWHLPLMLLEWDSFIKSMVSQTPHKIFLS